MLSPQLRQRVNELWTLFWSSGMTNPLTAIEQITYMLFLKQLEQADALRIQRGKSSLYGPRSDCQLRHHPDDGDASNGCPGHQTCRWSYISKSLSPVPDPTDPVGKRQITLHEHISQIVFPWLRVLEETIRLLGGDDNGMQDLSQRMDDAYFQLPREKTNTLQRAIGIIDKLFRYVDTRSANADLMGDIFEHLLSEITSAGKNGQFRTPRHIIRFMIELLDPQPGERIIDPAAGTGGFLINSIQHILKKNTPSGNLLLEWDGTPQRAYGGNLEIEQHLIGQNFVGYDNDRTMVRLGWMNMILHGIEYPAIHQRDSLGKQFPEQSNTFRHVLANPPFTGNVDKDDIHEQRIPRDPRKSSDPITNKSELLFVWVMLDLLQIGGTTAVIVPEGVLFGSTTAHKELRRTLLLENRLNAVISLPAGVFLPYSGVKTSILVFQKIDEALKPGAPPRTEQVWFYEVTGDGYTLDNKREARPEPGANDLWDVLAKWPSRDVSIDYYEPDYFDVRQRMVDEQVVELFPKATAGMEDRVWGIHELFKELPENPEEATRQTVTQQQPHIADLFRRYLAAGEAKALEAAQNKESLGKKQQAFIDVQEKHLRGLNSLFHQAMRDELESGFEDHGRKALSPLLDEARQAAQASIKGQAAELIPNGAPNTEPTAGATAEAATADDWQTEVSAIVLEFAKLDGYNVKLRTPEVFRQTDHLKESRSWLVPVRAFLVDEAWTWQSEDGARQLTGSHDENGQMRPEYLDCLKQTEIFEADGAVKSEFLDQYLDPDCIEANDFNLSAGRYKPFTLKAVDYDPPAQIIQELQTLEGQIQTRLNNLLAMVEGRE